MPSAIRDPTPTFLQPGQESVLDSPLTKALRMIATVIGADNPTSQVLALMNPLEVGPGGGLMKAMGGLVEKAQKLYRGAPDLRSRLEGAVATLPNRPIPAGQVVSVAKKAGTSDDELAYRLGEFLSQQGTKPVTKAEIEAQLARRPILPRVKSMGDDFDPSQLVIERQRQSATQGSYTLTYKGNKLGTFADDIKLVAPSAPGEPAQWTGKTDEEVQALASRFKSVGNTKFSRYQVPGGEDYRETIFTLPKQNNAAYDDLVRQREAADEAIRAFQGGDRFKTAPPELIARYNAAQGELDRLFPHAPGELATPDYIPPASHSLPPNTLVHTRSNVRDLPEAGRGTFLEEVQSDWHQKGKKSGYQRPEPPRAPVVVQSITPDDHGYKVVFSDGGESYVGKGTIGANADSQDVIDYFTPQMERRNAAIASAVKEAVPDAPYKEAWPDLALKHHLLEAANDPNVNWLGFTGGSTQAARYDLSKQVGKVMYDESSHTLTAWDVPGSRTVMQESGITPQKLQDYIGKEAAEKIMAVAPDDEGTRILAGLDLQVGGEGMREFYDKLLPARLNKLVKPFGGTVEAGTLNAPVGRPTQYEDLQAWQDALREGPTPEPLWFARLTPEMKARIAKEGFPALMALMASGELLRPDPEPVP